ncbi:hypothetical protein [Natrarchaeobaculum sulfurireducens]|uniref:Uncharacterized protein n=1 Tax=Natrarchaeobaculum sulfurireducens TaxID=2044521 RepID=A0A346PJD6_9EURY|nr:hypothetical protein [Natrarchaeobaculum sulfurireducens]AXR79631.1 hypothetical protein AArc1_3331 [Natrarchaeobaculum sulfurireducens]
MTDPIWKFPEQKSGITEYHKNPTESALDSTLETFVREVLQNANDQGISEEEPVKVTFDFTTLTGSELGEFLKTLIWEEHDGSPEDLRWHIERAIENDQARDPGLKRFLNHFDGDSLTILTIHDEHTTGLRGNETDTKEPYASLVKDFGSTNKPGSSSGGSKGLGKTVLWAFSGLSTVLFNSHPDSFPPDGGDEPPRLVGRTIVPAHTDKDETTHYTNHGWYGRNNPDRIDDIGRPSSLWGDLDDADRLADTLSVSRPTDNYGTSIGVVGFRIPGRESEPDMEELAASFRHASVKYFWPAMVRDELEVHVETPDGTQTEATLDDAPGVKPYVKCYSEYFDITDTELSGAGSFAKREVPIEIPREDPETVDEDPHDGYQTAVDLVVRHLTPADRTAFDADDDDELGINHVARLRGAQMVVDYVDMSRAANRGKDFVAVMVAGEAQTRPDEDVSEAETALEKFLKRSEPTQHDDWIGSDNDYLNEHYIGTITAEINALKGERLEAVINDIVQEDIDSGDEVPGMDDIAPIMDGRDTDNGEDSALSWETRPDVWIDDERWQFFAKGGPSDPDHGGWTLTVKLVRLDSQGHEGESVPIDEFEVVEGEADDSVDADGVAHLEADGTADRVAFQGGSIQLDGFSRDPGELFDVGEATQTKIKISAEIMEE